MSIPERVIAVKALTYEAGCGLCFLLDMLQTASTSMPILPLSLSDTGRACLGDAWGAASSSLDLAATGERNSLLVLVECVHALLYQTNGALAVLEPLCQQAEAKGRQDERLKMIVLTFPNRTFDTSCSSRREERT